MIEIKFVLCRMSCFKGLYVECIFSIEGVYFYDEVIWECCDVV